MPIDTFIHSSPLSAPTSRCTAVQRQSSLGCREVLPYGHHGLHQAHPSGHLVWLPIIKITHLILHRAHRYVEASAARLLCGAVSMMTREPTASPIMSMLSSQLLISFPLALALHRPIRLGQCERATSSSQTSWRLACSQKSTEYA